MNRIETDFKEIKDYEDIETYYKDLDNKINDLRFIAGEIAGDRVESQKYIVRANREIERLNNIIKEVREYINENEDYFYNYPLVSREHLLEILDKENKQ